MASEKMKELREKSVPELRKEVVDIQRALFGMRLQLANQASENTASLSKLKRDIARVKTVLNEKSRTGVAAEKAEEGKEGK